MARPREFDDDDVIERAMIAFWRNGYESTSIGALEDATGISRISLYNAFGDKSSLFTRSLEKYAADTRNFFSSNEFRDGGLDSIVKLFENASRKRDKDAPEHHGCLMLNTILDIETVGEDAKTIVAQTRKFMAKGLQGAMQKAIADGEMEQTPLSELKDRADFLIAALWGGRMTVRLHGDITMSRGVARAVIATVNAWRRNTAPTK